MSACQLKVDPELLLGDEVSGVKKHILEGDPSWQLRPPSWPFE